MERIELSAETLSLDETGAPDHIIYGPRIHAAERRIFYIDVGNMPKQKAAEHLEEILVKYKRKEEVNAGFFYCPYIPTF